MCDSLSDGSLSDSLSYYGGVISHSYTKWDADSDPTSTTATGMRRNSLANAYTVAMGKNPHNIDYNQSAM